MKNDWTVKTDWVVEREIDERAVVWEALGKEVEAARQTYLDALVRRLDDFANTHGLTKDHMYKSLLRKGMESEARYYAAKSTAWVDTTGYESWW